MSNDDESTSVWYYDHGDLFKNKIIIKIITTL